MSTIRLLLVLALTAATGVLAQSGSKCKVMTAALEQGRIVLAFYGRQFVMVDTGRRRELRRGHLATLNGRTNYVTAAYHPWDDPGSKIMIYGKNYIKNKGKLTKLSKRFPNWSLFHGGVDAATLYDGSELIFKGCNMVVRNKNGSGLFDIRSKMGLPCDIDAATLYDGSELIFKGCNMVVRNKNGSGLFDIRSKMGLPCGIDAAWKQGPYAYVTKGRDVYRISSLNDKAKKITCSMKSVIWQICKCRK